MGFSPVGLACQCPRKFDADCVILFALRQVIADDQKEDGKAHGYDAFYFNGFSHGNQEGEGGQKEIQRGDEPARYVVDSFLGIAFGIGFQAYLHHNIEQRE